MPMPDAHHARMEAPQRLCGATLMDSQRGLSAAAFLRARGRLKCASQPSQPLSSLLVASGLPACAQKSISPSSLAASQRALLRSEVDVDALDLDVVEDPVEVILAQLLAQLVHELLKVRLRLRGQGSAAGT